MNIEPFDESLRHREIVPYNNVYAEIFSKVKKQVESSIKTVELYHIGSTAIPALRGKPMIDIIAVSSRKNLRDEQKRFIKLNFQKRDVWTDTDDKPYICGSVSLRDLTYNINIHICHDEDWIHKEALNFVNAMKSRGDLRRKYELAKEKAHSLEPSDPERYNQAKNQVLKEIYTEINSRI